MSCYSSFCAILALFSYYYSVERFVFALVLFVYSVLPLCYTSKKKQKKNLWWKAVVELNLIIYVMESAYLYFRGVSALDNVCCWMHAAASYLCSHASCMFCTCGYVCMCVLTERRVHSHSTLRTVTPEFVECDQILSLAFPSSNIVSYLLFIRHLLSIFFKCLRINDRLLWMLRFV